MSIGELGEALDFLDEQRRREAKALEKANRRR